MKALLIGSLLISTTSFAQSIDVNGFKKLLTERKATLERVTQGMSKKLVTASKIVTEFGVCEYTQTAVQTVLKQEGTKIIVHSKESFAPASSEACVNVGYEAYEDSILYYEDAPSLDADLADLDATAGNIKSITKAGNIVTMNLSFVDSQEDGTTTTEAITVKYDLTKSSFSNLISQTGSDFTMTSVELPLVDVNTIDLKKVFFCENNDGDNSECIEGDFSDILF